MDLVRSLAFAIVFKTLIHFDFQHVIKCSLKIYFSRHALIVQLQYISWYTLIAHVYTTNSISLYVIQDTIEIQRDKESNFVSHHNNNDYQQSVSINYDLLHRFKLIFDHTLNTSIIILVIERFSQFNYIWQCIKKTEKEMNYFLCLSNTIFFNLHHMVFLIFKAIIRWLVIDTQNIKADIHHHYTIFCTILYHCVQYFV